MKDSISRKSKACTKRTLLLLFCIFQLYVTYDYECLKKTIKIINQQKKKMLDL